MPSETLRIRPARSRDIAAMLALLEILFTIETDFSFNRDRHAAGLRLLLASDSSLLLVAEQSGRVVGMCSGQTVISTAEGGPALLVEDLVVDEAARTRGIGSRLLEGLALWAAARGASRLQLLADRTNHRALSFYSRRGWQTTQLICLRTFTGTAASTEDGSV